MNPLADRKKRNLSPLVAGQRFGKLTVVKQATPLFRNTAYVVACDCGSERTQTKYNLQHGIVRSCGCGRKAAKTKFTSPRVTHGQTGSPTWTTWQSMLQRVYNPSHRAYASYGGRGISVCEKWQTFEGFCDDMGDRPSGASLDRWPDNNGDYTKSNCRWASPSQQTRNTRTTVRARFFGMDVALADLADRFGLSNSVVQGRIRRGWDFDRALTTPQLRMHAK